MTDQPNPGVTEVDDEEIVDDETEGGPSSRPGERRPSRRRWILFGVLAAVVLALDQLAKAWIVGNLEMGQAVSVLGDWLRLVHWRNTGILFGMLPESGPAFAIVSMGVVGLIVVYHAKVGRGIVTSVALGLLLGGALGNLVDRLRYGSVVDFVDMGIGSARFYTYNVGDAAITTAIILLILMAVAPSVAEWGVDD